MAPFKQKVAEKVRQYPCLYDQKDKGFKEVLKTERSQIVGRSGWPWSGPLGD